MTPASRIGVLALQGAYQKHIELLQAEGYNCCTIRQPAELEPCNALIIPGGESTTISLLIQKNGLYEPIRAFASKYPVMGVCAGLILMASDIDDARVTPLGILPFRAKRNYYGRQLHSFTTDITLAFDPDRTFPATFIRAPGIEVTSAETDVVASCGDEAVMIQAGRHVALSFHPELTGDTRIHRYWLNRQTKPESENPV
ncbi:MAG TPA: pyridoxal 5'-phosphate synthase glutaminase subunit PdxT [Thiotrichales bacterium]|nr:pyridoxal 5'-phosphate synthase glutaminase subunit PdxT [Thiotrichales bacterium]